MRFFTYNKLSHYPLKKQVPPHILQLEKVQNNKIEFVAILLYQYSMKKILHVLKIILLSAAVFLLVLAAGLTIYNRIKFSDFYKSRTIIAKNPGLWDNYVTQGLTYNDKQNYFATCGYMKNGKTSRIYTVERDSQKISCYELLSEAKPFTGHAGGLQYDDGKFYLANGEEGLYIFSAEELKTDSSKIEIGTPVKMNDIVCAFVFVDRDFIYTGEFAHEPYYICKHPVTHNNTVHTALMGKYAKNDVSKPVAYYSLPDKVQGFATDAEGNIYLSTSWGLSPSCFLFYSKDSVIKMNENYNGVPLYFLGDPTSVLFAPSFSEDLDIVDGKIISCTEGASNKYIIGKFYFDYYISALKPETFINEQ